MFALEASNTGSKYLRSRMSHFFFSLLFGLVLALLIGQDIGESYAMAERSSRQGGSLADLPIAAQSAVAASLGRDDVTYHIAAMDRGHRAENTAHNLAIDFSRNGVRVRAGGNQWRIQLIGIGYGDAVQPLTEAAPQASANRVEFQRGIVKEWYVNTLLGLEQGFTIDRAPLGERGLPGDHGLLTLSLALSGDLTATVDADGKGLSLARSDGVTLLRYGGLMAFDAKGKQLRAWLELREARLLLRVDDADAQYPITVDPTVQGAKLTPPDSAACYQFGRSVAISGDTIVVGADDFFVGPGSAYVFVKPPGGWTNASSYDAKLTASDGGSNDRFGISVAISSNANTIAVGAHFGDKAYVYVKPWGGWSGNRTETARLTAARASYFGISVAVSDDTVVVGASGSSAAYASNSR